jgi:hypothetical protein
MINKSDTAHRVLDRITRITPTLWSDFEASTTSLLSAWRPVVDNFPGAVSPSPSPRFPFSAASLLVHAGTEADTRTCPPRRFPQLSANVQQGLPADIARAFAAPVVQVTACRSAIMWPDGDGARRSGSPWRGGRLGPFLPVAPGVAFVVAPSGKKGRSCVASGSRSWLLPR